MFIDSHCHLEGPKYDPDRASVLRRARDAGVEALLAIGNGESRQTLGCGIKVARLQSAETPRIFTTVGVHPHEARIVDDFVLADLEQLAHSAEVIAWGEIGLDYWYDFSPREQQRNAFRHQMELARAARLPIVIHCRPSANSQNAWDETIALLRHHWASSGLGGVLHCFTGAPAHAAAALEMGFMLSFAGNITFPKAQPIRDAAHMAPLDRILIETDSPYLAPIPFRGRRNEPAYVTEVARQIGALRQMTVEEVGAQTSANFYRFFNQT
jgi:TatD DNase family protein